MSMLEHSGENLGTKIVDIARGYVGKRLEEVFDMSLYVKSYSEPHRMPVCGDFVRKVLEDVGVQVPGRLRDFGELVDFEYRGAGDLFFIYSTDKSYELNSPGQAAILVEPDVLVGLWQRQVREVPYEVGMYFGTELYRYRIRRVNE
ncbi:MAG: hypothetical protein IH934_03120 [Nanoarchaeota archaeon]|nr:hypothetical protein [Nanoarchaeota archaeon]